MIKRLLPLVLVVAATLSACGKDEPQPSASGDPITSTTEGESTTTAAAVPAATVTLKASEYAFSGTNLSFPAGPLQVTIDNEGKEEHQATIVRFKPGKTLADLSAVAGANPGQLGDVVDVFGGPNAAAPGDGSATTLQSLDPGDYYFMCFIPGPDGVPHAAKGMVAPFTVTGSPAAAAEPADNALSLQEYSFGVGEDGLKAGAYTVTNKGTQLHEAAIYAPAEGKTAQDVIDYFKQQNPSGPPPVDPDGGVAPLSPGKSATLDLAKGDYVFICFLPDVADNAPHFSKGMIQEVKVK